MNREKLIAVGINYEEGLSRFMGQVSMYEKYLLMFCDDDNFINAEKALAAHDYLTFFNCMHTIKGVVGNLSITNLYQISQELVVLYRANKYDELDEKFILFKETYYKVCKVLKEEGK